MSDLVDEILTRFVIDTSSYDAGTRRMISDSIRVQRQFDLVGGTLKGLGDRLNGVSLSSIRQAASMQREMASLEALTGSAEGARRAFEYFDQRAGKSIFNLTEIVEAGKLMTAYGLSTQKYLPVAEDLAAGMNKRLEETTRIFGRLRAGDFGEAFEALRDVGISRSDLEGQGLVFDKSNSYKGSVDDALAAVERIVQKRFGGISEKLATTTLEGSVSQLQDSWGRLSRDIGGSQLPAATNFINGLTKSVDSLRDSLSPAAQTAIFFAGPLSTVAGFAFDAYGKFRLYRAAVDLSSLANIANATATGAQTVAQDAQNASMLTGIARARILGYHMRALATVGGIAGVELAGNALEKHFNVQPNSNEDYWATILKRGLQGGIGGAFVGGLPGAAIGFGGGLLFGVGENLFSAYGDKSAASQSLREANERQAAFRDAQRRGQGLQAIREGNGGMTPREAATLWSRGTNPMEVQAQAGNSLDRALAMFRSGGDPNAILQQILREQQQASAAFANVGANTHRIAGHTKALESLNEFRYGAGDLGEIGVTPVEFAGGRRTNYAPLTLNVPGTDRLSDAIREIVGGFVNEQRRQGVIL